MYVVLNCSKYFTSTSNMPAVQNNPTQLLIDQVEQT